MGTTLFVWVCADVETFYRAKLALQICVCVVWVEGTFFLWLLFSPLLESRFTHPLYCYSISLVLFCESNVISLPSCCRSVASCTSDLRSTELFLDIGLDLPKKKQTISVSFVCWVPSPTKVCVLPRIDISSWASLSRFMHAAYCHPVGVCFVVF